MKCGAATAMHPHTTLRSLLIHPKDKVVPEEQDEPVYQCLCKSSGTANTGDTGSLRPD